jgi:hypothetical protein
MTWDRVKAAYRQHSKALQADNFYIQEYGGGNGFGIAVAWGTPPKRKAHSAMVSRAMPASLSDEQLDQAVSAAVARLAEWRAANA